jgi:hypothetical protein
MSERFEVINAETAKKIGIETYYGYKGEKFFWLLIENLPDGTKRLVGEDGGEPEDQLLVRDWKWVAPALNDAFKDGRQSAFDEIAATQKAKVAP